MLCTILGAASGLIRYRIEISERMVNPSFEGRSGFTSMFIVLVGTFKMVVVKKL
jgi:hypothetical protein